MFRKETFWVNQAALLFALLCMWCQQGSHALCTPGRRAAVQVALAMRSKLSPARHALHLAPKHVPSFPLTSSATTGGAAAG